MYEDFCEECQYRQDPMIQPLDQRACGGPMPMQGSMPMMQGSMPMMQGSMPMMQGAMPMMQGSMPMQGFMGMPTMQSPMMQTPYNINQPMTPMMPPMSQGAGMFTPGFPSSGMPTQTQMQQPEGPSVIPGATFPQAPGSPVYLDPNYMQGHLRTLVGRYVKVEFLIGTNSLIDREGVLIEVGISYIVLREAQTDDNLMCDIFSIKFVRVYY
jgi:hypothetical protein